MRNANQRAVISFASVLALVGVVGCQVTLVEPHDPRISEGLSDYQLALEDFTLKVLRRSTNQVRHRLCPGSPWERDTATSRSRRDAACAA